ncbi:MAG TPA: NAD(P)H-dependent oxidoreductase subunit E [Candidatus Polarisedimenticolia bacterium]|nr:NAD(P)H-dependent oxidoreductase subunit E [Candidatus Polarisedimenticolia bacterium]
MDVHLTDARASAEEQSAVDNLLGPPESGWEGGKRRIGIDDRVAFGGQEKRAQRHLLLPALHAVQSRVGWISPGALNYIAVRLDVAPAEVHGVASFYGMFSLAPRPAVVAHVCDDIGCLARGAESLCKKLESQLGPAGSPSLNGRATWVRSTCLGLCERAPAALVTTSAEEPRERVLAPADPAGVESLLRDAVAGKLPAEPDALSTKLSVPQAGRPELRLLRRVGQVNPASLDDYKQKDGYDALRRALDLGPEGVVREVIESRLLGRGGAAFPTGKKWEALLAQRGRDRTYYVVCNADESEPGTFKDRIVMEGDPFAVLEGMTIAGLATGAQKGFIYLRGEYPLAAERLAHAIQAARTNGFLGDDILGRGLRFDIELRRGAGAYICGEETALFNSIEGYRGEPRNKPPFPTQAGLFRQPTVVNNVETLINVPEIIRMGGAAYARIGTANSAGYRLFCLCGHVGRPGVYEVPFGATLRNLIDLAGGVGGNGRLQAVLLGGAAGTFVSPKELDTLLTFEGTRAIGASLGSGVIMLFDDSTDLKQILLRIAGFFRHETCGQCVPCRVGTVRQHEALERLVKKSPLGSTAQEVSTLREMAQAMRDASICGLGQTASSALESALNRWSLF